MSRSTSDQVRITYIEELTPGVTPSGNMEEFRLIDESLSGTPKITESDESTSDGHPTGQVITGLDVGGAINVQLAPTKSHYDGIRWGMRSPWGGSITTGTQTLTIDATAGTVTGAGTTFVTDGFKANDMVSLTGFSNDENNTIVQILSLTETVITFVGPNTMVDETGAGTEVIARPEYVDWGTENKFVTIAKDFLDMTDKSITYRKHRVSKLMLEFTYGQIAKAAFTFAGAGYDLPTTPLTDGRTINPVGSESALNASSDLGMVIVDGVRAPYCIEGLKVDIDCGVQPVECLGSLAPHDQVATGLTVNINADVFLSDENFDFHNKKLSQSAVAISYFARDENNKGYAVQVPAAQFSFDDAGKKGRKQLNKLSLSGVCKKDTAFGGTIRIYKLV